MKRWASRHVIIRLNSKKMGQEAYRIVLRVVVFLHFILLLSIIIDSIASSVHLLFPLGCDQACARQALLCECRLHTLLA